MVLFEASNFPINSGKREFNSRLGWLREFARSALILRMVFGCGLHFSAKIEIFPVQRELPGIGHWGRGRVG